MRVALFTGTFPSLSETFIARQIAGLISLHHEVQIYAERRPEPYLPQSLEVAADGLLSRIAYLDMPPASGYWEWPAFPPWGRTWLPGAAMPIPNIVRLWEVVPALLRCIAHVPMLTARFLNPAEYGYAARSLSNIYRVSALLGGRGKYDVAHVHFGPVANNVRFISDLWDVPLVVSFHGYDFGAWPREKGDDVYSRLFSAADIVTANSNFTRMRLAVLGCPARKIYVLHMGLDLDRFIFRERTLLDDAPVEVLSVGRLVEKKGFEYAIRAISTCREKHPRIRYSIVGDGPLRGELQALIDELDVETIVTLCGAGSGEFVRRKMDAAHIFLVPSVTAADGDVEGQGVVLQEAQACGIPVLATDHNGFPEGMVPGRSGFLVPERDVAGIAGRLDYMVEHSKMWPTWGLAGRKHIQENYDIRELSYQLETIYNRARDLYRMRKHRR